MHVSPLWVYCLFSSHRALSRVPGAVEQVLIITCIHSVLVCIGQSHSPSSSSPPLYLVSPMFVLTICVSITTVNKSSIPFFQISHIRVNIRYLFFRLSFIVYGSL